MIHIDFSPSSRRINCIVNTYNYTFTPFFVTLCTRKFISRPVSFKTITDIYKSTLSDRL